MPNELMDVDARGLPTEHQILRDLLQIVEECAVCSEDEEDRASYRRIANTARRALDEWKRKIARQS